MSQTPKRIVIAAGGTAGHVVPALAVACALRDSQAEVEFIGGRRAEAELVPAAGFPLHAIAVEGLSRSNPLRALRAIVRAGLAVMRSRALLRRIAPDAVMGGGGYVGGTVALAALTLRMPVVLTEADSRLGLANRALAPFAFRVCLAFEGSAPRSRPGRGHAQRAQRRDGRAGGRYLFTGRPVLAGPSDRSQARERFGVDPAETFVLVFGGSLGARSINRAAAEAFTDAAFRVLHISGSRDYPELAQRALPAGYDLREYLDVADFAQALLAADLAVARAGGSVFELAAAGLPAILVPYPHAAADHQSANARWMREAGAALEIADGELTAERLRAEVAGLLGDRPRLARMASASASLARPGAAAAVAGELLRAAGR